LGDEKIYKLSDYLAENFSEVVFDGSAIATMGDLTAQSHTSLLDVFGMGEQEETEQEDEVISNFEFSCALLSANNRDEFINSIKILATFKYKVKLTGNISNKLYLDYLHLARIKLTEMLFSELNDRRVSNYLKILEKRMKEHFGKDDVEISTDNDIKISFEIVE